MKKQISFLFAIALLLFLAACEEENALTTIDTTPVTEEDSGIPAELLPEPFIGEVESFEKPTVDVQPETLENTLLQEMEEGGVTFRGTETFYLGGPRQNGIMTCGQALTGTTAGKSNSFNNDFYHKFGLYANLNGGDQVYELKLDRASIVSLDLTKTTNNMSMLLFRGNMSCTSTYCKLTLEKVVAYSSSSSTVEEHLAPTHLEAGYYLLIIDGAPGKPSGFSLKMSCTSPIQCDSKGFSVLNDDFDSYYPGDLSPQAPHWKKWNANATYDASVIGAGANKMALLARKPNVLNYNQPDALLDLGKRTKGQYTLKFQMYVPSARSAQFTLQKKLTPGNLQNEVNAAVFFYGDKKGVINVGGKSIPFAYPQSQWMEIRFHFGISGQGPIANNVVVMYINGQAKASWPLTAQVGPTTGSKQIEGINFYPYASNSYFFLDKFCFSEL